MLDKQNSRPICDQSTSLVSHDTKKAYDSIQSNVAYDSMNAFIQKNKTNKNKNKQKKRVRFLSKDEYSTEVDVNIIPVIKPLSEMSISERRSTWWQKKDYQFFRYTSELICEEMYQGQRFDKCMVKTFTACSISFPRNDHTTTKENKFENEPHCLINDNNNERTSSSSSSSSPSSSSSSTSTSSFYPETLKYGPNERSLFKELVRWIKRCHSIRGLEHGSAINFRKMANVAQRASIEAVLLEQCQQKKDLASLVVDDDDIIINREKYRDEQANSLRLLSESVTNPAREFALVMGAADAMICHDEQ